MLKHDTASCQTNFVYRKFARKRQNLVPLPTDLQAPLPLWCCTHHPVSYIHCTTHLHQSRPQQTGLSSHKCQNPAVLWNQKDSNTDLCRQSLFQPKIKRENNAINQNIKKKKCTRSKPSFFLDLNQDYRAWDVSDKHLSSLWAMTAFLSLN